MWLQWNIVPKTLLGVICIKTLNAITNDKLYNNKAVTILQSRDSTIQRIERIIRLNED